MVIGIDASRANLHERTGTERYSLEIILHLVRRHPEQRFILYLKSAPIPELRDLGGNVEYRILRWPPKFLWNQLRLSFSLLWRRPDVLFVPAHTIPLLHPKRTVTTIHDLGFEHEEQVYATSRIGGKGVTGRLFSLIARLLTLGRYGNSELDYHRWSARFAARSAWKIITISNATKEDLINKYNAESKKIFVIYHGFNRRDFKKPDENAIQQSKKKWGIEKPYFIYVGRLEKKKNILLLLQAFEQFSKGRNLDLVLVGRPGTGWDQASEYIKSSGLQNRIHVLGWQPDNVYINLLSGSSGLIFLSQFEGFGLPLLEAFALEVPVVASNVSALPEVAGNAAILVNPSNLSEVLAGMDTILNTNEREKLIHTGLQRVQDFSWEKAADQTFSVLTQS